MSKKKKRKKLKIKSLLLFLFVLGLLFVLVYLLIKVPVRGFIVEGNTYYTDQEILDMTGLSKYPSFLLTNSYKVSRKVKNDKLIDNIKIKKTITFTYKVIVNDKKILFYDENIKKSITSNNEKIDYYDDNTPVFINEVKNKKIYNKLVEKMSLVSNDILKNISEIKYDPNEIDDERFCLSMNDGNYVYVTLSKFSNVNNYLKISRTLSSNGILYLDYGNYFVPKE